MQIYFTVYAKYQGREYGVYKDVKEETDLVRDKVREFYRAEICDESFFYI